MHSTVSSLLPASLLKAKEAAQQNSVGEKKEEEEEEDLSLAYAARGQGSTYYYLGKTLDWIFKISKKEST